MNKFLSTALVALSGTATAITANVPVTMAGTAPLSKFSPVSVTYVSTAQGWVLGTVPCATDHCYRLLHTTNDGAAWSMLPALPARAQRAGDGEVPLKVRFADSNDGWIFSTLPGEGTPGAWSTHDGGRHWAAISLPVKVPSGYSGYGLEDIEAAAGRVYAAAQVGDGIEIYASPVSVNAWHYAGGPFLLGAGPVPNGSLTLQGRAGWFVQDDRTVVSAGRLGPSGSWTGWAPPCARAGGPVVLAAPDGSRVDAICTEGVWTGPKVTVDLLASSDAGNTFGPSHLLPVTNAEIGAATGASTLAVGATVSGPASSYAVLEMSFDNGTSWQPVYRVAGPGWSELGFTTTEQGVAIVLGNQGARNTMLFTTDGGRRWSPVNFA